MHTNMCANDEAAVYTVERRAVTLNSYLPPDLQGAKGVCSGERNVLSHSAPAEPHSLSPTKVEQISSASVIIRNSGVLLATSCWLNGE